MENVITLGKLIGLLFSLSYSSSFLFCFCKLQPLRLTYIQKKRNELARLVMGTFVLVNNSYYVFTKFALRKARYGSAR